MHTQDERRDAAPALGLGYGQFQLAKALLAYTEHPDAATRERAAARVERWQNILVNIVSGTVRYGDQSPFHDVPAWVTLEVATGGFATGRLLAGGQLLPHERAQLARLSHVDEPGARLALNMHALSEEGLADLQSRLASGDYTVDVPEEGALLVVAWLLSQGHVEQAHALIDALAPLFERVRFYPAPGAPRDTQGTHVHRESAHAVAKRLDRLKPQPRIATQRNAVDVWLPLYDQLVGLALDVIEAAWPSPTPRDWKLRMEAFIAEIERIAKTDLHTLNSRARRRFLELFSILGRYCRAPKTLEAKQFARAEEIAHDFLRAHGRPDSAAHLAKREAQRAQVAGVPFEAIARVVAARLHALVPNEGVAEIAPLVVPVTEDESQRFGVPAGTAVPVSIARRLRLCRSGTLRELIAEGIVTSGEVMATLLPALTSNIMAQRYDDAALRELHGAIYRAFRRRRSLLLLNLQRQVAVQDLPWIAVLKEFASTGTQRGEAARVALAEATAIALEAFPQAILPNKLVRELQALSQAAGMNLPWLEELAADIFMGEFSPKYAQSARRAAKLLDGTLYARYYAIDCEQVLAQSRGEKRQSNRWWRSAARAPEADAFAALCARRAGVGTGRHQPAWNGAVIEEAQILTTHNLATALFDAGDADALRPHLSRMAFACFAWTCKTLQHEPDGWHARLIAIKNAAYAWRQMVFYLSWVEQAELEATVEAMEAHFAQQSHAFRHRFEPAVTGLRVAADGSTSPTFGQLHGGRVFVGWTVDRHWLLPDRVDVPLPES